MSPTWPAEWQTHSESIVVWPGRPDVWDPHLDLARSEVARLVAEIAKREPVRLVTHPRAPGALGAGLVSPPGVETVEIPTNDCWARDIAPLFVLDGGVEIAVDLQFNSWGQKFQPYDDDAAFAERLAASLDLRTLKAGFVGEGGGIEVDGEGTAIVVEPSILNDNRNPGMSRIDIERCLRDRLGVSAVIWLPYGLSDDTDTDGHVDNIARFVGPTTVVCQVKGRDDDDTARLRANHDVLLRSRDALGRQLTVIELPWLPYGELSACRPASYCNFYLANGAVLIPIVGSRSDELALELLGEIARREAVGVPASAMAYGGGGVHCVVMPRFNPSSPIITTRS